MKKSRYTDSQIMANPYAYDWPISVGSGNLREALFVGIGCTDGHNGLPLNQ